MTIFSKVRFTLQKPDLTTQVLPSFLVMALVLSARALGLLEPLDLTAFDTFLKLRPSEPSDDQITLVKITQKDIQRWGGYPISNEKIIELVEELQQHNPTVIGLNLLGDLLPDNNQDLVSLFKKYDNLVIAEKILPPQILSPKGIHPNQVGFTDIQLDSDHHLRRIILGTPNPINLDEFRFSFAIQLAQKYLATHDYILENGIINADAMRFGNTEIPLLENDYGGYIDINAGGLQTLINYRQNSSPFSELSIQDIEQNVYSSHQVAHKIIVVGVTDPVTRNTITTPLLPFSQQYMTGIDIQGHTVSQITSAVLDSRKLLKWKPEIEYLYIASWLTLYLILLNTLGPIRINISLTIVAVVLSWILIVLGYWVSPFIPISFLILNGFISLGINRIKKEQAEVINEKTQKKKIQDQKNKIQKESDLRQEIIDRIFSVIHNGPLQTLSALIRVANDKGDIALTQKLEVLDKELRCIGEFSKSPSHDFDRQLYLGNNRFLDLNLPMHELLYYIFNKTIERDLRELRKIKLKVRSFDPIDSALEKHLSLQNKRDLCWFLEEMLCNIGKHGVGVSSLKAIGHFDRTFSLYILQVEDNGSVLDLTHQGEGTKKARQIATSCQGYFCRQKAESGETVCELIWPLTNCFNADSEEGKL